MKPKLILAGMAIAVGCTILANSGHTAAQPLAKADRILIEKAMRRLTLYHSDKILAQYRVALGSHPSGKKEFEGDGKTPEGNYVIDQHHPHSSYHLSLHISYPNENDRRNAARHNKSAGGQIMIHGLPNGIGFIKVPHTLVDWTAGCIAVSNEEIEQIYAAVDDGTPVRIAP